MKYLSASCWIALYLSLVVLLGQILERVSARYPSIPEDKALTDLKQRFEKNRQASRCKRLEAVWDEAQEILEEEKASRILKLAYDEQPFALDPDYDNASNGRHIA